MAHRLWRPVAPLRIEPPFQLVTLDDQGAGDQAVLLAQRRVTDVDQQCAFGSRCGGLVGADPLVVLPYPVEQLVDADRTLSVPL